MGTWTKGIGWAALVSQCLVDGKMGCSFLDWWGASPLQRWVGYTFLVTAGFHIVFVSAAIAGRLPCRRMAAWCLAMVMLQVLGCLPLLLSPWMWIAAVLYVLCKSPLILGLALLVPVEKESPPNEHQK